MKKVVLSFLTICWILPLSTSYSQDYQSGTEKQINPDNGHAYQRFDTPLTWSNAKTACEGLGSHLATITSQAENDWVVYHMTADAGLSVWIGGTDQVQDGVWEWVTGEAWNYTNWYTDEPNNFCGGESYVTLWGIETPRRWNDYGGPGCNSDVTSSYLCEWENSAPFDMMPVYKLLLRRNR